jgi:hypothetical protein
MLILGKEEKAALDGFRELKAKCCGESSDKPNLG